MTLKWLFRLSSIMISKISNPKLTIFKASSVHSWTIALIRNFSSLFTATKRFLCHHIAPVTKTWKATTTDQVEVLINRFKKLNIACLEDEIKQKWEVYCKHYLETLHKIRRDYDDCRINGSFQIFSHFRLTSGEQNLTEIFRHLACTSRLASTSWYCPSYGVLCQTDYPTDEYNKEKRATSNWTWLHENS